MTTNKKVLLLILSVAIISLTTIASYTFFTVSVAGNNTAYNTVIQTGEMNLRLVDSEPVNIQNTLPGTSSAKTFKVKNTGTIQTNYDVYVSEIFSEFVDTPDLVGGAGTRYSSSYTNGERAIIDGGVTNPGYFTLKS